MKPLILTLFMALAGVPSVTAGLLASFKSGGGATDLRLDRLPALVVKKDSPPTPFLPPGKFTVNWSGKLKLEQRQRLYFSFEGKGTAALTIDGEDVLAEEGALGGKMSERLRLDPGEHDLKITYTSADDGSAHFRLFWEERTFPKEAVPPGAFAAIEPGADDGVRQLLVRSGRALFAQQNCAKCHLPDQPFSDGSMPELRGDAPNLSEIGNRVTEDWLRHWIADPHLHKPSTTMPTNIDYTTDAGKQQAADLAAYLAALGEQRPRNAPVGPEYVVKKGGQHFHELGCVACHTLPDVKKPDIAGGRIPLNNIAWKYQPGELEAWLRNPRLHYASSKMPDFRLTGLEIKALTAYIEETSRGNEVKSIEFKEPGDMGRGQNLARQMNCAACHLGNAAHNKKGIPTLAALTKKLQAGTSPFANVTALQQSGCLSNNRPSATGAPRMNLTKEQKNQIAHFLAYDPQFASLCRDTPAEFATRQYESMRCNACHSRDGEPSLLDGLHKESERLVDTTASAEFKIEQTRPHLTFAGEMLNSSYIEGILDGRAKASARPWLQMRMPAFHHGPKHFAEGLAAMHGIAPGAPDASPRDEKAAANGKSIVGLQGLACVTCHGVNDSPPLAVNEVQGINFGLVHERLRPEFFHRWMHNPQRVRADSKMPRYTNDDGSALRADLLDGDAKAQFMAVWEYLKAGPKLEKP